MAAIIDENDLVRQTNPSEFLHTCADQRSQILSFVEDWHDNGNPDATIHGSHHPRYLPIFAILDSKWQITIGMAVVTMLWNGMANCRPNENLSIAFVETWG